MGSAGSATEPKLMEHVDAELASYLKASDEAGLACLVEMQDRAFSVRRGLARPLGWMP
jgi:hypothetical protein